MTKVGIISDTHGLLCPEALEAELKIDPVAAGFQVVGYGHSHKLAIERKDGVLYVNPGSAGPK